MLISLSVFTLYFIFTHLTCPVLWLTYDNFERFSIFRGFRKISVCPSVRVEELGSHWTEFHEIWYFSIFRYYVEKIKILLKSDKTALYESLSPFIIISRSIVLRMRNVFEKGFRENQNTHFVFNNIFPENHVENYGRTRQGTGDRMIRRMRISCLTTKATDTHPEYVMLSAFPKQKWLRERASLLRYV